MGLCATWVFTRKKLISSVYFQHLSTSNEYKLYGVIVNCFGLITRRSCRQLALLMVTMQRACMQVTSIRS